MEYELKRLRRGESTQILKDLLRRLEGIEPEDLTSFEYQLIHRIAVNPPRTGGRADEKIMRSDD